MENSISFEDVEAVEIHIRDLGVEVDSSPSIFHPSTYPHFRRDAFSKLPNPHKKRLIHSISCTFKPGTLTAIIGGSGSGKTTFLNAISGRSPSRISKSGSITANGIEGLDHVRHAYVMQQDILLPSLSVRETLRYSADLRLPTLISKEQRRKIVEEVILELGLKECVDTRVGDHYRRGCSGGERRRTSIGVQLLLNPSALFLDEPTTGLDAMTAFQLVKTLKKLADKGRTVITTLHQPRSETWSCFDSLIILSKGGHLLYSGPRNQCISWFESLGHTLSPFVNPFDFLADLAAIDNRTLELEQESTERVKILRESWKHKENFSDSLVQYRSDGSSQEISRFQLRKKTVNFFRQVRVLTSRTFVTTYREPMGMAASIMEAVMMGVVCGYLFFKVPSTLSGIKSRQGAVYSAGGLQGYLVLIFETYRLTIDIPTFDRENQEGCVDVVPFLLSRRFARLLTEDIPVPVIFSLIFFFMVGFDISKFPKFFAIVLLNHYIAVSCAQTCVATARHFAASSLMANCIYTLQTLAAGYFIQSNSIPVYLRWIKYITYNYYVFTGLCSNEFEGSFYDCPDPAGEASPACVPYTGRYVLDSLAIPNNWVITSTLAEIAFIAFFSVLNIIGLTIIKVRMGNTKSQASNKFHSSIALNSGGSSSKQMRPLFVDLQNFGVDVEQRTIRGTTTKTILHPITASFQPGTINVILGSSGSGKTSLLNSIGLRLRNSAMTKYKIFGNLGFNGAVPSQTVIKSICSYVAQDDDALFPSLTVRESLFFAADLRLPSWVPKYERMRRANNIMLKLGLKDCADIQIGGNFPPMKGISGGEKRRTTIATQMLSDPQILLLDEPTSGLDAFTANSIMEVLRDLASEGRTIIMTIHQARSDIFFDYFGTVLLLTRGGSPIYSGNANEMIGYFSNLGHECPQHTNPADFALDLSTVDLQEETRELASRQTVSALIDSWEKHIASRKKEISRMEGGSDSAETAVTFKNSISTPAELDAFVRKQKPAWNVLPTLLRRSTVNLSRQPFLILARTMQVLGLAVLLALFLAPLGNDYFSIQNFIGFLQNTAAFYFIGVLQNLAVYPAERNMFYLEHDDGLYSPEAFLLSYTLLEIPFEVTSCLISGIFAVFAVRLPQSLSVYFGYFFSCFAIVSCGESLGIIFNTIFADHLGFSINFPTVMVALAQLFAGSMSVDMPPFLRAMNYLNPARYTLRAMAQLTLPHRRFTCGEAERQLDGQCIISTGEQVLDLYKLRGTGAISIAALAALTVGYRIVGWAILRIVKINLDRQRLI